MYIVKSVGKRGQPCLTPMVLLIKFDNPCVVKEGLEHANNIQNRSEESIQNANVSKSLEEDI